MKIMQAVYKKKLSDELFASGIGILMVLLFASFLFITSLIAEIKMKQFFSEQQLRHVLGKRFQVYAEESQLPEKLFGTTITHGSRDKKQIALTFDADMTPSMKRQLEAKSIATFFDKRIITTLETTHTKATIFLTGMWIEEYPREAKAFAANPLFELGNHSYSHPSFFGSCYGLEVIGDDVKQVQIQKTQQLLLSLTGENNHLFRFPGGCSSEKDLGLLRKYQLVAVLWDVVSGDAFGHDTQHIIQNVLGGTQNGSIIVMHLNGAPTAPKTAEALPEIIKQLKEKGYEFVTISELLTN